MARKNRNLKAKLPGTIYKNGNRFWWKVKLPGENKTKARPLIPLGSKVATCRKEVAFECANRLWAKAIFDQQQKIEHIHNLAELAAAYTNYAKSYYVHDNGKEIKQIKYALRPLVECFADMPIEDFGPKNLKETRRHMIANNISRKVINSRVGRIKRMFKWAVSEQIISPIVFQGLQCVDGLRKGYTNARETRPRSTVDEKYVYRILPYASPTIAAMIELQLLTGMRPCELVIMRPCDITREGNIWHYKPKKHKNSFRGLERIVSLGPRAQQILRPFLVKEPNLYCFSPKDAEKYRRGLLTMQRKTPLSCGNRVGNNRKARPKVAPRDHYDTRSYGQGVKRAINAARKAIKAKGGDPDAELPKWTPYQLRHTAATKARKMFNYETAGALLGHSNMSATAIYAERNQGLADEAAKKFG